MVQPTLERPAHFGYLDRKRLVTTRHAVLFIGETQMQQRVARDCLPGDAVRQTTCRISQFYGVTVIRQAELAAARPLNLSVEISSRNTSAKDDKRFAGVQACAKGKNVPASFFSI